jgi:hypothetical protein
LHPEWAKIRGSGQTIKMLLNSPLVPASDISSYVAVRAILLTVLFSGAIRQVQAIMESAPEGRKKKSGFRQVDIGCLLLLLGLAMLKIDVLKLPLHWDSMGYVMDSAQRLEGAGTWLERIGSTVHPPLYYAGLLLDWKVFGQNLIASHAFDLFVGVLGLAFIFLLAKHLYGRTAGLISVALLGMNQLYFAQWGSNHLEIASAASAIAAVYFYTKEKRAAYVISAAAMLLVKETTTIVLAAIIIFDLVRSVSEKKTAAAVAKRIIFMSIPVVPLGLWLLLHWQVTGSVVNTRLVVNRYDVLSLFPQNLFRYFVFDYTAERVNRIYWLPLSLIIAYFVRRAKLSTIRENQRHFSPEWLFGLIIVLNVLTFSYTDDMPRYFVIVQPFFVLLAVRAVLWATEYMRRKTLWRTIAVVLIIGVAATNFYGTRSVSGWRLESNMEYADLVRVKKDCCSFIEANYPGFDVICNFPLSVALQVPWYGYVQEKFSVAKFERFSERKNVLITWLAQSNSPAFTRFIAANKKQLIFIKAFERRGKYIKIYIKKSPGPRKAILSE